MFHKKDARLIRVKDGKVRTTMVTALSHIARFDTPVAFISTNLLTDILSIVKSTATNCRLYTHREIPFFYSIPHDVLDDWHTRNHITKQTQPNKDRSNLRRKRQMHKTHRKGQYGYTLKNTKHKAVFFL